ncbi:MAG TPA: hypothetical protein ENI22_02570 [Candidatus Pacearchaeota archaeon]|nr:hypothetical protein [Candidatus Pacearchaeota archaeon]
MGKIFVNRIIIAKLRKFQKDNSKKWRRGVLFSGTFYDLTDELKREKKQELEFMRKNIKKKLEKISERIKDFSGKTTHFIISLRDMEKINLKNEHGKRKRRKKRSS